MAVQAGVIVPHQLVVPGTPVDDTAFHLIVAAQQGEGSVMVQPLQVADGFLRELLGHLRRQIDVGAGDHEVLPHQQAVLIAQLVEAAVGVVPAAPDPQGVEVGVHSLTDDGFPPLVGDAAAAGNTVAVMSPYDGRERRAMCLQIVAAHRSTTVDNRGYLLVFNNNLPKQHFRI